MIYVAPDSTNESGRIISSELGRSATVSFSQLAAIFHVAHGAILL